MHWRQVIDADGKQKPKRDQPAFIYLFDFIHEHEKDYITNEGGNCHPIAKHGKRRRAFLILH